MRDVLIDQSGARRCPKCQGKTFYTKRSKKAKFLFGFLALLGPKRLQCVHCGSLFKGKRPEQWTDPALPEAASSGSRGPLESTERG